MYKLFYSKKKIEEKIDNLNHIIKDTIGKLADPETKYSENFAKQWEAARTAVNMTVLELCLGGEFTHNNEKFRFHGHVPNHEQANRIMTLLKTLRSIERPAYADANCEIDMIPTPIQSLNDMKPRELRKAIVKKDGAIINDIGPDDVNYLLIIGEKIRKGEIRNTAIIIGGTTLILSGAAIAAVLFSKWSKSANTNENPECADGEIHDDETIDADDMDSDADPDDIGDIIDDTDDTPDVIVEDDIPEV